MSLLTEILAGVTIGVLAIPQGLSFASVAGLPSVYGLYNSIAPVLGYAVLGTSPHLVVGPTAVMSLVVRGSIPRTTPQHVPVDEASDEWVAYALALSFVSGLFQLVFGGLGLGVFLRLVSEPVMSGFVTASALLMMIGQVSGLLGIHKCNASDLLGEGHDYDECFIQEYVASLVKHADEIHVATTVLSVFSLVLLIVFKYAIPSNRVILSRSGPIVLVVLFQPIFYYLAKHYGSYEDDKHREYESRFDIRLVGAIPSGLPKPNLPFDGVPGNVFKNFLNLLAPGLVIAVLSFTESMAIASAIARKTQLGDLSPTKELLGLGAANVLCSMFSGYPVTGSFSRTAVNADAGARRHQVSSLISSIVIILTLLFFTSAVRYMPKFALAAIVFMSVVPLVDVKEALFLYRTSRLDFGAYALVVMVTLVAGIVKGLGSGILVTWVGTLMHLPIPKVSLVKVVSERRDQFVDVLDDDGDAAVVAGEDQARACCDVMVLTVRTNLVFSSVDPVLMATERAGHLFQPMALVLECSNVRLVDASGIHVLGVLAEGLTTKFSPQQQDAQQPPPVVLVGLGEDAKRVLQRAKDADAAIQDLWNLNPIVGGVSQAKPPKLVCFATVNEALVWLKSRGFLSRAAGGAAGGSSSTPLLHQEREPSEMARDLISQAQLTRWRANDPAPDHEACRLPSFARHEFELMAAPREWLVGGQRA